MNQFLGFRVLLVTILWLTGCQSVWKVPIPDSEIVYQGEGIYRSSGHKLGFIDSNGNNNNVIVPNRQFDKPVWSTNGEFLFGLSGATGSYMGYPAYWDLRKGLFGVCDKKLPYFNKIQGSDNIENPYEVIVQDVWTIKKIDLSNCKHIQTLVDYSSVHDEVSIAGFSYAPSDQKLVYGEVSYPYQDREYRLMLIDLKTGEKKELGEGINPSWSPDGTQIAYIGLDGLYILDISDLETEPRQLINQAFFDPWVGGSPWGFVSTPSWSPDSTKLVYHRCNAEKTCTWKNSRIYIIPSNGGQEEIILQGGEYPNWRPKTIVYN